MIEIGMIFNRRYKILDAIGSGGMANVFLAHDLILDRDVAIKVLRGNFQNDPIAVRRFQREAHAASELVHPNVVAVYDVGEENGMQYLVMEYVKGMDLKKYIKENYPLPNERIVEIMREILAAMSLAHEHRIIHRDLKPQNILIAEDGAAKITDFGIAIALAETSITQTNSMMGSVHYLSPEQARGAMATNRSDIYAMGIVLFELLTGTIPFDGESAVTIALKHFQEEIPDIHQFNSNIPQALVNVALIATAKDANKRYSSAEAMSADISTALSAERAHEKRVDLDDMLEKTKTQVIQPIHPQTKNNVPGIALKREDTQSLKPIEETEEDLQKKKRRRLVIPFTILGVLAIVLIIFLMVMPGTVVMPDVNGRTLEAATAEIESRGLRVGEQREEESDTVAEGQIIKTDPAAHTPVRRGSTIHLYVSTGISTIAMPNFVGETFDHATEELRSKGFVLARILNVGQASDTVPVGQIISQSVEEGTNINPETDTVTFNVSTGPNVAQLADYTGMQFDTAVTALLQAGFSATQIIRVEQVLSNVPPGQVISQSPGPNVFVNLNGGNVTLHVAVAPAQVLIPNLQGKTRGEVDAWAHTNSIVVNFTEEYSDSVDSGRVISNSNANINMDVGSTIAVILSKGARPEPTPPPANNNNNDNNSNNDNNTPDTTDEADTDANGGTGTNNNNP